MIRAEKRYAVRAGELDELLNAVEELTRMRTAIKEELGERSLGLLSGLELVTRDLQGVAMRLRLVPMQPLLERVSLAAKGAALIKGTNLVVEGSGFEQTELDLAVLERAALPLEQIASALTEAAAKLACEKLALKASASGNLSTVRIELRLSSAEHVVVSREMQVLNLARAALRSLQADVEFSHDPSTRELVAAVQLPTSLVTLEVLVVRCANTRYAIPTASIEEAICPQTLASGEVPRELEHRGRNIPVFTLEGLLGKPVANGPRSDVAFVLRTPAGDAFSLWVDEVLEAREVVLKPLGEDLGELPGVVGGAVLPDGTPTLVIDVQQVAETAL